MYSRAKEVGRRFPHARSPPSRGELSTALRTFIHICPLFLRRGRRGTARFPTLGSTAIFESQRSGRPWAGSIALVQLTELKHQRMKQCAEFQQRSRWQPPYALTTALELQAIEIPRLPKGRAMLNGITVVVPSANERRNLVGINEVTWSFPVDVVMVEQCLCVSPACTWAMFAGWLESRRADRTGGVNDAPGWAPAQDDH